MSTLDRQQLLQYLETSIPHQDNPESFRYQIDTEISRALKQHQHNLKSQQSKIKFNQILQTDLQKRQKLKKQLQEKTRKGIEHRQKLIAERAKSLIELNKRRELLQREKVKQNRKAQLLRSLKKIEEFQAKNRSIQQFKLNKSLSQRNLRSESKLNQREEAQNSKYNAIVDKLESKGIFTLPSKELQSIYSHKATYRNQSQKKLKKMEQKLGVSLSKIEQARRKKEALLMQRSQKIHQNEKFQFELKQGKWKEIQAEENKKRKELQIKQAKKILKAKAAQGTQYQRSSTEKDYQQVEVQLGAEKVRVKNPSYREQIRKHIDHFLKGKHT